MTRIEKAFASDGRDGALGITCAPGNSGQLQLHAAIDDRCSSHGYFRAKENPSRFFTPTAARTPMATRSSTMRATVVPTGIPSARDPEMQTASHTLVVYT